VGWFGPLEKLIEVYKGFPITVTGQVFVVWKETSGGAETPLETIAISNTVLFNTGMRELLLNALGVNAGAPTPATRAHMVKTTSFTQFHIDDTKASHAGWVLYTAPALETLLLVIVTQTTVPVVWEVENNAGGQIHSGNTWVAGSPTATNEAPKGMVLEDRGVGSDQFYCGGTLDTVPDLSLPVGKTDGSIMYDVRFKFEASAP
jgi:hypothetical protein